MGFSLRNVVDIDQVLREILRVLKPGARFVNLDVSKAPNRLFKRFFDLYFYRVVPLVGGVVGGSKHRVHLSAEFADASSQRRRPSRALCASRFRACGFRAPHGRVDRDPLWNETLMASALRSDESRPLRTGRRLLSATRSPPIIRSSPKRCGACSPQAASACVRASRCSAHAACGADPVAPPASGGVHGTDPRRDADSRRRRR